MTDIPCSPQSGPHTWQLALPDWGHLDSVWQRPVPFALWSVGEQPLLFHWFDAAVDQGTAKVILYVADRPADVRQAIERVSLWPIELEVRSVPTIEGREVDDCVDRLPRMPPLAQAPDPGWGLIQYWHKIEMAWLDLFTEETKPYGIYAAIGRSCEIAEDAKLIPPFWLGNHVSVGPSSVIGPHAVIEDGCIIAGNNRIERAHLGAHTYLGPETDLIDAAIHQNELLNFKHQAQVCGLESFLAGSIGRAQARDRSRPSWRDRWRAARLYWRWRANRSGAGADFTAIDGSQWPALASRVACDRAPWLWQVARGKLALFGVTPREAGALEDLPDEWQSILRTAPMGAFSYADVMGAHEPGEMDEALHCVYQTTGDGARCRELFDNWLEQTLDTQI